MDHLTLTSLLENSGARLSFYDVGRRIQAIARDDFLAFEQTLTPYPLPLQGKAWFALVQQQASLDNADPVIWFLRLDLDEQGKLLLAARDYLIQRLLETASAGRAAGQDPDKALADNPYVFSPRDDRMAVFHARLGLDLGRAPSKFFDHALAYFHGDVGWDQWSFLGYQGIAEVAARVDQPAIGSTLAEAIPRLPDEPLVALLHCLENSRVGPVPGAAILDRLQSLRGQSNSRDNPLFAAGVRGLSRALDGAQRDRMIELALDDPGPTPVETLAALGGRAWEGLREPGPARRYLAALADPRQQAGVFAHCLADLLAIPGMRGPLLSALREPDLPSTVKQAFSALQSAT